MKFPQLQLLAFYADIIVQIYLILFYQIFVEKIYQDLSVGDKIKCENEVEFTIEDISQCKWDDFDTIILGHVEELSILTKKDLQYEIIEKCLEYGINLYAYDNFGMELFLLKLIVLGHQLN